MSFEYKKGHVVNVWFPNDNPDGPALKDRPCIILDKISDTHFKFICITGTDWSETKKGFWIRENTKDFYAMRLAKSSFINLEDIKVLPQNAIRNYRGTCLKMAEIEELLNL